MKSEHKESEHNDEFTDEQHEVLKSIRTSRIILPILIGIGVVIYMLLQQFNLEEFWQIKWTKYTTFWVGLSLLLLVIRHLSYATRLRILSEKEFTWKKCIELIFIWEFSSAVSPTSIGGSAVSLFVLAQEKLSTGRTSTIVLYTAVLDTLFFVGTLPIWFMIFGTNMIRPNVTSVGDLGGWGFTFIIAYVLMAAYGSLFYYGLFENPKLIKRFFYGLSNIKILKRYRTNLRKLGEDMVGASQHMKRQNWKFHVGAFAATAGAWSCRFLLLNCLIIAFVATSSVDLWSQFGLFARLQTMFVIIAFSPTPGGAGFVEVLFGGFLIDYLGNVTNGTIISTIWRLFTYYAYLLAGAIIIPNWIRTILNERSKKKQLASEDGK